MNNSEGAERFFRLKKQTPFFVLSRGQLIENFYNFQQSFGNGVGIYYSVKANPHPVILKTLKDMGAFFEVASGGEIKKLIELEIDSSRIVFSNPIKKPTDIWGAFNYGIKYFSFDSLSEIEKIAQLAPGSFVYLRLEVDNEGSVWPLDKKFGVDPRGAIDLLRIAKTRGLIPAGITFHVGSQCTSPKSWEKALTKCSYIYDKLNQEGVEMFLLNLGGGFPAQYNGNTPKLNEIARIIRNTIDEKFPKVTKIMIEPGRSMVASIGTLAASVIGRTVRNKKQWIYLDMGVFNGLMEAYEDLRIPLVLPKNRQALPRYRSVLAGPTCDSVDAFYEDIALPRLEVGDRIVFEQAGAYTTSYVEYNGFPFPEEIIEPAASNIFENKKELQLRSSEGHSN